MKIHISVADVNDNPPFFKQDRYETSIKENADVNQDVITIKASDQDERECRADPKTCSQSPASGTT